MCGGHYRFGSVAAAHTRKCVKQCVGGGICDTGGMDRYGIHFPPCIMKRLLGWFVGGGFFLEIYVENDRHVVPIRFGDLRIPTIPQHHHQNHHHHPPPSFTYTHTR